MEGSPATEGCFSFLRNEPMSKPISEIIKRLEESIDRLEDCPREVDGHLLAAAGEALGALRVLGDLSYSQLLYDFARLAGQAGETPDDFEHKANQ